MNEVIDLSFIDRMDDILATDPRQHLRDTLRDFLRRRLSHIQDDAEKAIDYAKRLSSEGGDITVELQEMEDFGLSLQLQVRMIRKFIERATEKPEQFWTE